MASNPPSSLSAPPRGVRVSAPVAHLFRVPLPRYSELELERLRALLRRRPLLKRGMRR